MSIIRDCVQRALQEHVNLQKLNVYVAHDCTGETTPTLIIIIQQLAAILLNVKVDYLIIRHEDSRMHYKRGCPGQKPYLSIFVRYEEARRSGEHFRVSFELLLL